MIDIDVLDEIKMHWQGNDPFFDKFPESDATKPTSGYEFRPILTVTRTASLKDIVLAFCGYMTIFDSDTIKNSPTGKLVLALCALILVNPFEMKVLRGKGIDPLIDASAFDEETGERFINRTQFIIFCEENELPLSILDWLESKKFIYFDKDRIVFKRTFKNGRIFWKS